MSTSKMQLLRKQMSESRSKFEQQQKDQIENKVMMDEMKKKINKLKKEVEDRDSLIHQFEKGGVPEQSQPSTTQQLCQQLLQKDAIVTSLSAKVNELENLCRDQKESLEQKESIISARTEAVTLVAKDRDERFLTITEQLSEKEELLNKITTEFREAQNKWEEECKISKKTIAEKSNRINLLEENAKRIETMRFELTTRNAELQEKIVVLQTERIEIEELLNSERKKNSERDASLTELSLKLSKAEAHGAKKLKALEKQLKNIKKGGNSQESGEYLVDLHNQMAVLEEEKGNLQLQACKL